MIVISSFNPDTPRSTEDETQLTVMLSALIRWNSLAKRSEFGAMDEVKRQWYRDEQKAVFQLLPKIAALLGLTLLDITELVAEDFRKCIEISGSDK